MTNVESKIEVKTKMYTIRITPSYYLTIKNRAKLLGFKHVAHYISYCINNDLTGQLNIFEDVV